MALLISNRCDVQESQNTFLQIYSSRLKPEWEYTTMMLPSQRSERHVAAHAILDAFVFYPVHTYCVLARSSNPTAPSYSRTSSQPNCLDFGRIPFDTNCFVAVAPLVHFHVIPLHSSARFHPDVETDIPTGFLRSVFPFQPTASSLLGVPLVCACLRVVQRDPMRCAFCTAPSLATRRTLQSSYRRTWKDEASRRRWRP